MLNQGGGFCLAIIYVVIGGLQGLRCLSHLSCIRCSCCQFGFSLSCVHFLCLKSVQLFHILHWVLGRVFSKAFTPCENKWICLKIEWSDSSGFNMTAYLARNRDIWSVYITELLHCITVYITEVRQWIYLCCVLISLCRNSAHILLCFRNFYNVCHHLSCLPC